MSFVTSSIARKFVMSITGIFLITFLIAHLTGNLLLLKSDGGEAFNVYAHFMKHNILIILSEFVLAAGFLFHIVQGIALVIENRKARPIQYSYGDKAETKSKFSKWMGPLGIAILVLLIIHLLDFFAYKYTADLMGGVGMKTYDGVEMADLATLVYAKFSNILYVILYVVFMLVLAFHLHHGFHSAFQSLGLNHKKYSPIIKKVGTVYAILIPLAFALIPIMIYFGCTGASCSAH